MLGDLGAGDHHCAAGGGEVPGHPFDLSAVDLAPRGQVVEVRLSDQPTQVRHAGGEFGAVLTVFEALVENELHHRQQQCPILSRPHRQMNIGPVRALRPQRIDDHDRRAAFWRSSARRQPPGTVSSQFHALTAGFVPTSRK